MAKCPHSNELQEQFIFEMIQFLQSVEEYVESPFGNQGLTFQSSFLSDYQDVQNNASLFFTPSQNHQSRFIQPDNLTDQNLESNNYSFSLENFREDSSTTKPYTQEKQSPQTLPSQDALTFQRIERIILVLMHFSERGEKILEHLRKIYVDDDQKLGYIFDTLAKRFKRLKKTKEEMTKHCMRKAFKFIAEKNDVSIKKSCMARKFFDEYFGSEEQVGQGVEIPLGKQTEMKTMNRRFLIKVFRSPRFLADYKQHLESFNIIAEKSNKRKIQFLALAIQQFLKKGTLQKLETFKRLPWTPTILNSIISLSSDLMVKFVPKIIQPAESQSGLTLKKRKGRPKKYQYRCPGLYQVPVIYLNSNPPAPSDQ